MGLGHPARVCWLARGQWAPLRTRDSPLPSSRSRGALDASSSTAHGARVSQAPCPAGAPSLDTPGHQAPPTASPWRLVPEPISQLIQEENEEDASISPAKRFNSQGTWSPRHQCGLVPGSFLICILMKLPRPHKALCLAPTEVARLGPRRPLVRGLGAGRGGEQSVSDHFTCEVTLTVSDGLQSPLNLGPRENTSDKCPIKCSVCLLSCSVMSYSL